MKIHFAMCLFSSAALAAEPPPEWWTGEDTAIISNHAANNFAPVAVGHLKYVAKQAAKYLNTTLAPVGGAGPVIDETVSQFEPRAGVTYLPAELEQIKSNNRSPANIGQIKNIGKPFYDRLIAIGYDTKANLLARDYPSTWAHDYPWIPETLQAANYVPANLGQLKLIFSFSLTDFNLSAVDADQDNLPDEWEVGYGLDPHDANGDNGPSGDLDNDGVTNRSEHSGGTVPNDPALNPDDADSDGMVDNTEGVEPRLKTIVGLKDHQDPQLRVLLMK